MVAVQLSMFLFCLLSTCFVDLNNQSHFLLFVNVFFYLRSFKRRRRDLNPRAAINDLLPFQGSPFSHLGTSPSNSLQVIHYLKTEKVGFEPTVPFGITGFQDRLLKPLGHLSSCLLRSVSVTCSIIISLLFTYVNNIFQLFLFFYFS